MSRSERYPLDKPQTKARILALLLEGKGDKATANALASEGLCTVSMQAITKFRARHATEIDELEARAVEAVTREAVTQKVERIRRLARIADELEAVLDEHGFMWAEPHGEKRTVLRPPVALIKELRGIYRDIAEELGDIPRAPAQTDAPGSGASAQATAVALAVNVSGEQVESQAAAQAAAAALLERFTVAAPTEGEAQK